MNGVRRPLAVGLTLAVTAVLAAQSSFAAPAFPTAVQGSVQQAYVAQPFVPTPEGGREQGNSPVQLPPSPLVLQAVDIGGGAIEPTLGIDEAGVAYFAGYDLDSPLFAPLVYRSVDGGLKWEPTNDMVGPTAVPPVTLDPYITVDEVTGRVFNPELNLIGGSFLQYSDDQGETWTQAPLCCGNPVNDHQTMVFGPPPEGGQQPIGYPNVGYYCFNRVADASCARSLDGGRTWVAAGAPVFAGVACPGDPLQSSFHGHLVVDANGRVYLPAGYCGKPHVFVSDDGALTWTDLVVSDDVGVVETEGIFGNHTSVDVDSDGTVYYLWWTDKEHLPVLAVSKDGGDSWSAPLNVAPPGVREVNFPTLDVGAKPGQVAISFPGAADGFDDAKPNHALPWNYYVTTSTNADSDRPLFVSATANRPGDPIHRGRCQGRCGNMFDFLDIEYAPSGEIWAAAVDTCTAKSDCIAANDAERDVATDGQAVAVRQLAGPGLAVPVRPGVPPAAPGRPVGPAPAAPGPDLPATGLPRWLLPAGLLAAALPALLHRQAGRRARRCAGPSTAVG